MFCLRRKPHIGVYLLPLRMLFPRSTKCFYDQADWTSSFQEESCCRGCRFCGSEWSPRRDPVGPFVEPSGPSGGIRCACAPRLFVF
jgi:hypothetical protein